MQLSDLCPLVLGNIVDFTLLARLVRIFGANCIDVVFCLILELPVEVGQLVARTGAPHVFPLHHFVGLLIDEESFARVDTSDVVLLLLSSNNEDFVLRLDACKV